MAKAKAKTAKTVKARVAVIYNAKGSYQAAGCWAPRRGRRPSDDELIDDAEGAAFDHVVDTLSHTCIVDVELPIPEPSKGKVVKVKRMNP